MRSVSSGTTLISPKSSANTGRTGRRFASLWMAGLARPRRFLPEVGATGPLRPLVVSAPTSGPGASGQIPSPSQTPLFHAINSARYARQDQIRQIEQRTGRRLLCWIAEPHAEIDKYDIAPMGDLLQHVADGEDIDLMLQTPGGDVDVAEKIVMMCRKRCGGLRVIVPEAAKRTLLRVHHCAAR